MSFTVIVTCDVQPRYRGFLASVMLEIAPGVYVSPRLNPPARERLWETLEGWYKHLSRGSIVMIWRSTKSAGRINALTLGVARRNIIEYEGLLLTRKK
jgi:CRISPR-associated protein Cas2